MNAQPATDVKPSDTLALLDKVLALEAKQGYRDASASGGLARFVGLRVAQLLEVATERTRRAVRDLDARFVDYASLRPAERADAVAEGQRLVQTLLDPSAQAASPLVSAVPRAPASRSATPKPAKTLAAPPKAGRHAPTAIIRSLADSVQLLPGVGPGRAAQLEVLGVQTVRDLLRLYPRHHVDYSAVQPIGSMLFGSMTTIQGVVQSVETQRTRTGKTFVDVVVADETGRIHATWFNPWLAKQLHEGMRVSLSGRVEQMRGNLTLSSPEWELLDAETLSTGRLVPVYPLTKNLYQKQVRSLVRHALDATRGLIPEHLPEDFRREQKVLGLPEAVEWAHFPEGDTPDEARQRLHWARRRLAFDEFLTLQLGLLQRKLQWQGQPGNSIHATPETLADFVDVLPYDLTGAQKRALDEILADMAKPEPMTRLLQGDVGSGKTVVAAAAAWVAIRAGYQVALMAPTEILAEQHQRGLTALFASVPAEQRPRMAFLSGSVGGAERTRVYAGVADGSIDLLIGTHALIQGTLEFANLGVAIVDEQHRFGVEQRGALRSKGRNADVLVMTATPIPRSLALTLHGDLDVSTLDELPPGRQAIETWWLQPRERVKAYNFIREQVSLGRQAFIVFPLVEESELVDAKAAVAEHERLAREVFPDLRLGLLHGRMKSAEKDAIMGAFRAGEVDILVSTSVVEVGIDVPNASVMLVDGADRFGLAQLHQFRGRVGRGAERSYCLLLAGDVSEDGRVRLQTMVDSQDGFHLAQVDMELRGPGDFLGTRQSGLPELSMASFADVRDLEKARAAAEGILAEDPQLASERWALLAARVSAFWSSAVADVS
jgi:ATP-dependent DNA helicase RecG